MQHDVAAWASRDGLLGLDPLLAQQLGQSGAQGGVGAPIATDHQT